MKKQKQGKDRNSVSSYMKLVSGLTPEETEDAIWKTRKEISELNYIYTDDAHDACIKEYQALEARKTDLCFELDRITYELNLLPDEAVIRLYPEAVSRQKEIHAEIAAIDKVITSVKSSAERYAEKQLGKLADRRYNLTCLLEELRVHKRETAAPLSVNGRSSKHSDKEQFLKHIDIFGFVGCRSF